jgi:hypothetical protein
MTTTINASPTNGLVQTADGSGVLKVQSNGVTTNALAWVNFNGATAGTNAARSSYNVTSVTKNAAGDYTINFTNAMTDTNYLMVGGISSNASSSSTMPIVKSATQLGAPSNQTTTTCQILNVNYSGAVTDNMTYIYCVFFGN